ncbi:MAG: hypothetical protein ABIR96_11545 [Bdellovibrionota bacterium]
MRRVLIGAFVGAFAFQAHAVSDDESVYDYLVDRSDASRDDIKSDLADIIAARKEEKTRLSTDELKSVKEERDSKELEVGFAGYLQSKVRGKLAARSDWDKRMDEASVATIETKLKEADLTKIELKKDESKVLDEKTYPIDKDSPFQVTQQLRIIEKSDNDHKLVVNYAVKIDESVPRSKWPSDMRRKFEKMDDAAVAKFMNDQLNVGLEKETFEIGKVEDLQKDDAKRAAVFKTLSKDIASNASTKIFGAATSSGMNHVISARLDTLGSRSKDLSEIWELSEQIERETDERGRKEKAADLQAKYDIAKALQANPKLASGKDPCEVMISVLGKERMQKLSSASQMDCESHFKKEEVAKEETKVEDESDQKAQVQQSQQALQYHNQLLSLAQSCMARAQQMGQTAAGNSPQITLVRSLYNALLARGAGCNYFGSMMGDITKDSIGDDAFSAQLFGANPYLLDSGVEDGQYADKAKEVVKRQTPPSPKGVDTLFKQRECLAKMESLAGMSLSSLTSFSNTGGLPPEALQDKNVRQMMKFQEASKSLIAAIDEELAVRNQTGSGGLKAMASSGIETGKPLSVAPLSGTSTPVRIRNTSSSQTERGASGIGTTNRMDSGTRTGGSKSPPPNFLGD